KRGATSASAKPARRSTPTQGAPRAAPAYDQQAVRRILDGEGEIGAGSGAGVTRSPDVAASEPPHQRLTQWSADVFQAIEWRRFEAVCEALFAQAGFETRAQSHGPDGGVDIWLHSRNASGPVAVVQCKHWQGKPVPVGAVREFLGAMAAHKVERGTYATSSTFTADALAFARANGINAQDGAGLLRLIGQRTPEQQAALLAVAFEGEYWRPTCPSCSVKLVERKKRRTGSRFWGCTNYPRCTYTLPMSGAATDMAAMPR
ncbi:restriction endonuclease, partial [Ottowia sp.]|uniref:restriction endonuclease n=1 Tax=Ottowia sp. TaxID=1898956 RepID=UPI002D1FA09A